MSSGNIADAANLSRRFEFFGVQASFEITMGDHLLSRLMSFAKGT